MKEKQERIVAAVAEPISGSPSVVRGGINIGDLYMDMLCERYKNRGIKTGLSDPKRKRDIEKRAMELGISTEGEPERREKYKTLKIDGKVYMSHDDFAAYYKELRGYKLPGFYSRAESEYETGIGGTKNVQESGKPPKKAIWLAVKRNTVDNAVSLFDTYIASERREHMKEEVKTVRAKRIPKGILPVFAAVTLSALLMVCSSVMVSRATSAVGQLENEIEVLEGEKTDLASALEVKNNMLDIKKIAVEEYGMIGGEYVSSRYLNLGEEEKIEVYDGKEKDGSLISQLLRAIGLKND